LNASGFRRGNLLADVPADLVNELTTVLAGNRNVRIERIVSTGQVSPAGFWYDQHEHEWVLVLQGAARLSIEGAGEPLELTAGDHALIPARTRHRVEWTVPREPTVWLAVFFAA